jgi:PhnB protein
MQLNPYLFFRGDCEAAFRFYERCLDGKIVATHTYEGTPGSEHLPPDWQKKVMHMALQVGQYTLMGSDCPPDRFQTPQGFSVSLSLKDTAAGERIFNALSEKAKVEMPLQETFWAARFGMLVDQFGISWMINCERPA